MSLAGNYIKGDDIDDPEKAMARDIAKKNMHPTRTAEVCRKEFIAAFTEDFGEVPDFNDPLIHTFFNGWVFAQGQREWLSEGEKIEKAKKEAKSRERVAKMAETKRLKEAERKVMARQRKAAADAQHRAKGAKA